MKPAEIREWDLSLLREREREFEEKLQRLRLEAGFGQFKTYDLIRKQRKDIARIKTIIREKQAAAAQAAQTSGRGERADKPPRPPAAAKRAPKADKTVSEE